MNNGLESKTRPVILYLILAGLFVAVTVLGFYLFSATKSFMKPSDISLIALTISALGVGVAAFFNPCVLPILPSYLVYQTQVRTSEEQSGISRVKVVRNGIYAALGLLVFMLLFGIVIGLLGETFVNFIKPGTVALLWFRRTIGGLLIVLGVMLLANKVFSGLGKVEEIGSAIGKRGSGNFGKFFIFGFSYTLAGIGCVAPLVGGLALFALSGGGLGPALIVFALASTMMASLMILLSVLSGFAHESVIKILISQIDPIRKLGGAFLVIMGGFNIIISLSPRLLELLP